MPSIDLILEELKLEKNTLKEATQHNFEIDFKSQINLKMLIFSIQVKIKILFKILIFNKKRKKIGLFESGSGKVLF